jgi:TRAP-type mannitol/chloroaromatic compound transport system substrate-binding protein
MKKSANVTFLITLFIWISVLVISGGTSMAADQVIKWRLQANTTPGSVHFIHSVEYVCNEIKRATNGRLEIQAFGASALVPSSEIFNAVKRGVVEMGMSNPAYYAADVPLSSVAHGIPFNVGDVWEWGYILEHMGLEKMLQAEYAKHGIYYRTDMVSRSMPVLKKPVRRLDDFKGLKIRSYGVLQNLLNNLGATASSLPGEEIYTALASGVIEGAHWGAVQGATDMGLFEVCKYFLNVSLSTGSGDVWFINMKALNKLPPDIQDVVYKLVNDQLWKRTASYLYQEHSTLANNIQKYGTIVLNLEPGEYEKMVKVALNMWNDIEAKNPGCKKGLDIIREFNRKMGRIK